MSLRFGVVMDPIAAIKPAKDTTLALLIEAQRRGWPLCYLEMGDLYLRDGVAWGRWRELQVSHDSQAWYTLGAAHDEPLHTLDALFMRKDPPFDTEYLMATYILERAQLAGAHVYNDPRALRDVNEKIFTAWFPQCCVPTLVTNEIARIKSFLTEQHDIIVKPLTLMGGASIFRIREDDANVNVICETMTHSGTQYTMAQRYVPEVRAGDKRILLIDGEPYAYALARIPAAGETRANMAVGGTGVGQPLTERDRWICQQVGTQLRTRGLIFVGLDVIGDYLTEINVTSPTGVRELEKQYGDNIAARILDCVAARAS
ncbi:MAG: glutathione synthase [Pseudomonadota bacterium]